MMAAEPVLFSSLLGKLAGISATFLRTQIEAGASMIQLFDSWSGCLSEADYRAHVLPHSKAVFASLADLGAPSIHFGVQTGELLTAMSEAGSDVVGVDFRAELEAAASRVGGLAVQGNLDPSILFAPWEAIQPKIAAIVEAGKRVPGHIFNLGHGVLPATDPDILARVVEEVHRLSAR